MEREEKELSQKQKKRDYPETWITAFLTSCKRGEVMELAHISKAQFYRLRNDEEFQAILTARRNDLIREAVLKMESYLSEDVDILQEIIRDPETKDQVKVNAIQLLMNQLGQWKGLTDIIERIQALEASQRLTGTF